MSKVQLHYGGWLALPEAERRKLGVTAGDRLEVEFRGGALVLRPAGRADASDRAAPEPKASAERPVEVAPAPTAAPVAKRGPGRPRKVPVDAALPPRPKARDRRAPAMAA